MCVWVGAPGGVGHKGGPARIARCRRFFFRGPLFPVRPTRLAPTHQHHAIHAAHADDGTERERREGERKQPGVQDSERPPSISLRSCLRPQPLRSCLGHQHTAPNASRVSACRTRKAATGREWFQQTEKKTKTRLTRRCRPPFGRSRSGTRGHRARMCRQTGRTEREGGKGPHGVRSDVRRCAFNARRAPTNSTSLPTHPAADARHGCHCVQTRWHWTGWWEGGGWRLGWPRVLALGNECQGVRRFCR